MNNIEIEEPAILIRINRAFRSSLSDTELYDYTRGRWKLNPDRAKNAKYGIAVFKGIVKEVYEISNWYSAGVTKSSRKLNDRTKLNSQESLIHRFEFKGEWLLNIFEKNIITNL